MVDQDFDAFAVEAARVATIFRFRASPIELKQITQAYFKAFKGRPLPVVVAGAEAWIEKGGRFPKPAEWIAAMPRAGVLDRPLMGKAEAAEWTRAERLRWEDLPCACVACLAAGIDRPLRFVPEVDEDGRDRHVVDPSGRLVTSGHWAHGVELLVWYAAKDAFYARCQKLELRGDPLTPKPKRISVKERKDKIFWKAQATPVVEREPGEEG
ncbi:MAG TPA: hypothetical protein VKR23_16035 [Gaiellaceae bacterium]|nr:hypothetical protein [Gaiellaceae bacterium]